MRTVDLNEVPLVEAGPVRVGFPVTGAPGTSAVYFELDPGASVGRHADSAEEIVLVLDGTAAATVGDERTELAAGQMAVVPANVPHDVRNAGDAVVRVVGFFGAGTVVSTFDEPVFPGGPDTFVAGRPFEPVELPSTLAV